MKKLFLISLIVLSLFSLSSCVTVQTEDKEVVVSTAINLAETYAKRGLYLDAIDVYNDALQKVEDYRLVYNKALIQAKNLQYDDAIITAENGLSMFENRRTDFLKALIYYSSEAGYTDKLFNYFETYLKENSSDTALRKLFMNKCFELGENDKAYNQALFLWNNKIYDKEVINVLYSINPEEWEIMNKVIN